MNDTADKNKVAEESKKLHQQIKKQLYTQQIEGKHVTYGWVEKKNKSGIMYNDRVLVVLDKDEIGYISKLSSGIILPFQTLANIPKRKGSYSFDRVQTISRKQDIVEIQMTNKGSPKDDAEKWIFKFANEKLAMDWEKIIQDAKKPKANQTAAFGGSITGMLSKFNPKSEQPKMDPVVDAQSKVQDPKKEDKPIEGTGSPQNNQSNQQSQIVSPPQIVSQPHINKAPSMLDSNMQPVQKQPSRQVSIASNQNTQPHQNEPIIEQKPLEPVAQPKPMTSSIKYPKSVPMFGKGKTQPPPPIDPVLDPALDPPADPIDKPPKAPEPQYVPPPPRQPEYIPPKVYVPPNQPQPQHTNEYLPVSKRETPAEQPIFKNAIEKSEQLSKSQSQKHLIVNNSQQKQTDPSGASQLLKNDEKPVHLPMSSIFKKDHEARKTQQEPKQTEPQQEKPEIDWNALQFTQEIGSLVIRFNQQATQLLISIVQDLCLPEKLRKYRPTHEFSNNSEYCQFVIRGISATLSFSTPKEQNRQPVYDQSASIMLKNEFNNMDYLFSCIQQDNIKVPLSCIVEYRGIIALIKAKVKGTNILSDIYQIDKEIEQISAKTRIHRRSFQENMRIVESEDQPNHYFLDDIAVYLPEDHLYKPFSINNRLQAQFLQNQQFRSKTTFTSSNRVNSSRNKQGLINTTDTNERLTSMIQELLLELEGVDEVVLTSEQLQNLMRSRGISVRYLGTMATRSIVPMIQQIFVSEMAARASAIILRNELQEILKNSPRSADHLVDDRRVFISYSKNQALRCAIDLLNSIVGTSQESQLLWKVISNQAERDFLYKINKKDISEGYFLQAILYHFNLKIKWKTYDGQIFTKKSAFNTNIIQNFNTKTEGYKIIDSAIERLLREQSEANMIQLTSQLELSNNGIPPIYPADRILTYLSNFVSPQEEQYSHLNIYKRNLHDPLTIEEFRRSLNEIKWWLKQDMSEKPYSLSKELTKRINQWGGQYHPLHSEVNLLFCSYYGMKGDHENAISMCKSSLVNSVKTLGNHSLKTAEKYYELGDVEESAGRRDEALVNFRKARAIFENENKVQTISYGLIETKIAKLDLYYGRMTEAEQAIRKSLEIFNKYRATCQNELSQAVELLERCYEVTGNTHQIKKLAESCDKMLNQVEDPLHLEKYVKMLWLQQAKALENHQRQKISQTITSMRTRVTEETYIKAYEKLKEIIEFEQGLSSSFKKFEDIQKMSRKELSRQGKEILQTLVCFLGQTYVQGCLDYL